jgi:glycosyltransferase involved in cell wall biosynthesis
VDEFDAPAFHAVLRETVRKWRPEIAQLEFTQMAQYAHDCAPARTLLVEHDITFDLYEQLVRQNGKRETRRQYELWRRFETAAWQQVDCVVTVSDRGRDFVAGARRATVLPNGVDIERFHPSSAAPEARRLLFIGAFQHLPNLIALDFFLHQVWPLLAGYGPRLHVIAGQRHEHFLNRYNHRERLELGQPGVEIEGFVSDVRPAYQRATLVVAPHQVSAGTNIKIMEAMAMGKAIVSTPAGIHGLDLSPGEDVIVAESAAAMARAIGELFDHPEERRAIEEQARLTVVREYNWDAIARKQRKLYQTIRPQSEGIQNLLY